MIRRFGFNRLHSNCGGGIVDDISVRTCFCGALPAVIFLAPFKNKEALRTCRIKALKAPHNSSHLKPCEITVSSAERTEPDEALLDPWSLRRVSSWAFLFPALGASWVDRWTLRLCALQRMSLPRSTRDRKTGSHELSAAHDPRASSMSSAVLFSLLDALLPSP